MGKMLPSTPAPRFEARFGQLDALGALQQGKFKRRTLDDVADELLPLGLETVLERLVLRQFLPVRKEIMGVGLVRVPDRLWGVHPVLDLAGVQSGNRTAVSPIHL